MLKVPSVMISSVPALRPFADASSAAVCVAPPKPPKPPPQMPQPEFHPPSELVEALGAAAAAFNGKIASGDIQHRFGLDAVVSRRNVDRTAGNIDIAARGILIVARTDSVTSGDDADCAAADFDAVLAVDAGFDGRHRDVAARDDKIVL